jgi:hypothetical protein
MFALLLTPAVLSLLVLAAHFLRRGEWLQCIAVLALLGALLFKRSSWVPRTTQIVLVAATLLWARTLTEMLKQRQADHEPAGRLVVILGSVIAVNVLAALLLAAGRVSRAYATKSPSTPAPEPPAS